MPIAPIVGKLRKRFFTDLALSFGVGIASGYAYWYGYHLPDIERRENFYIRLEREKLQSAHAS